MNSTPIKRALLWAEEMLGNTLVLAGYALVWCVERVFALIRGRDEEDAL